MTFFELVRCLIQLGGGLLLSGFFSAGAIIQLGATSLAVAAQSAGSNGQISQPGPEIESAVYVSSGNGRALEITNQLKSTCSRTPGACMVSCNNLLAGDPEFGRRKYCRISYRCSREKLQELQIQEGESRRLSCSSGELNAEVHQDVPAALNSLTNTPPSRGASVGSTGESANATTVQVLGRLPFVETQGEHVTFVMPLPDGGVIAATNVRGGASFIYKLSGEGVVVWRKMVMQHGLVRSGGVATAGGYWFGGDFVQRTGFDGSPTASQKVASAAPCAVEHDGSYIQIGTVDTLDEYFRMQVPSISMTDATGARTWNRLIPLDGGVRIEEVPQEILKCAGVLVTRDRHVIAAQRILVMPDLRSTDEIKRELATGSSLRPATLLVSLDLSGNVVRQLRHNDVVGGLVVAIPGGAILVESSYAKPGLQPIAPSDRHIHVYTFDSALQETAPQLVVAGSDFDVVQAALAAPGGGLWLAGCSGTSSHIFVRYMSPHRSVTRPASGVDLGYCGGSYWIGPGQHHHEALLLADSPNLGPYVARLTISE